jgi:hypothetical protein|tara:strand:+ start:699 stop:821 length:123 start_codon:yes stop_codon:yes gene_type:complete
MYFWFPTIRYAPTDKIHGYFELAEQTEEVGVRKDENGTTA